MWIKHWYRRIRYYFSSQSNDGRGVVVSAGDNAMISYKAVHLVDPFPLVVIFLKTKDKRLAKQRRTSHRIIDCYICPGMNQKPILKVVFEYRFDENSITSTVPIKYMRIPIDKIHVEASVPIDLSCKDFQEIQCVRIVLDYKHDYMFEVDSSGELHGTRTSEYLQNYDQPTRKPPIFSRGSITRKN